MTEMEMLTWLGLIFIGIGAFMVLLSKVDNEEAARILKLIEKRYWGDFPVFERLDE